MPAQLTISAAVLYLHRPENILYASPAPDAEPVIADFGLAKLLDAPGASKREGLIGTLDYLSPEVIIQRRYVLCSLCVRCFVSPHSIPSSMQLYANL